MSFPSPKQLAAVRKKLEKIEPTEILGKDATVSQRLKYDLCKKFVVYLRQHRMTQLELAKQLKIDPARLNQIVKYKIDQFTIDKLISYVQRLEPQIKIRVA